MKTFPRIGFVACVHPIYDLPSAARYREDAISGLRAAACHVITPPIARTPADVPKIVGELRREKIDLLIFFFCTWVAEEITLEIARELADVPLLLWALPYFDLCSPMPSPMTGITATACNLRQAGRSFTYRIGAAIPEQIEAVAVAARTAALVTKLRQARFGLFGSACPGMLDTVCDDSVLRKQLGISTLHLDLDTLLRAHEASSAEDAFRKALELREKLGRCEVEPATLAAQYRLCLGLKSLMEEYRLDGFSVQCWPELRDEHKLTVCLAMADMAESGIVSACEADLTALVTSYILTSLAGQPSCTLEITAYLEEQNALQLAHCGSAAMSLGGNPANVVVRSHMRTGTGALIELALKSGVVTIAKLLRPSEGRLKMFAGRGEIIPSNPETRGSVATIRVEPSPARFVQCIMNHGVEHHFVIVYGDWMEALAQFACFTGMELISPLGT